MTSSEVLEARMLRLVGLMTTPAVNPALVSQAPSGNKPKIFWIGSYALPARGWEDDWYARGDVCIKEPSGRVVQITRLEPRQIFTKQGRSGSPRPKPS